MDWRGALFWCLFCYKEAAVGLWGLYWLHQCGIPHRTCRFYLLLAGAVEERQGISIPYPSPTPLLTPMGIRCGGAYLLPRAYRDIGSFIPVQTVCPHFDMTFGCFVFGLGSLAFQKITLGICLSFFIGGGWTVRSCGYMMFCYNLSLGLPLTAPLYQYCMVQAHFTNIAACKSVVKKCVRAAETTRKQVFHTG